MKRLELMATWCLFRRSLCHVGSRFFQRFEPRSFSRCCFSLGCGASTWHVEKVYFVKMHLRACQKWPTSLGIYVTMDMRTFTPPEQPRTRRCTIHPCTLTTTLTQNTTNHLTPKTAQQSDLLDNFFQNIYIYQNIQGCFV